MNVKDRRLLHKERVQIIKGLLKPSPQPYGPFLVQDEMQAETNCDVIVNCMIYYRDEAFANLLSAMIAAYHNEIPHSPSSNDDSFVREFTISGEIKGDHNNTQCEEWSVVFEIGKERQETYHGRD